MEPPYTNFLHIQSPFLYIFWTAGFAVIIRYIVSEIKSQYLFFKNARKKSTSKNKMDDRLYYYVLEVMVK